MSRQIFIVDDDPNICRFLTESLKLRGYQVRSFGSGEELLQEPDIARCDLLLLDILLPGRSGSDVCRELRRRPKTTGLPIVLMTAFYREAEQIREARETYGATDYLLKPFTLAVLSQKVEELIGPATRGPLPGGVRIEGSLVETPFPQLLHNHYLLRATGLLHLERQTVKKVVYLRDGYPIFVRSNLVRECLGQMLVREGKLTAARCEESRQRARETGRLQGTVLIEMGILTPHELHAALARQVTEKLLEIFSWPEGTYRFLQAREFKKDITAITLSPATLVLEGIRRHYPPRKIDKLLLPLRNRYPVQTENPLYRYQDLQLSARDSRILAQCRGDLTLEQILALHPLTRRETGQLMAALLLVGMVEYRLNPTLLETEEVRWLDSPEGKQARETFLADYARMIRLDYFNLLGVGREAGPKDLRQAYFALVRKFHPDRFRQDYFSPDLQEKIKELFQRINEAHETLADRAKRRDYLAELNGTAATRPDVASVLQAEASFQKGMILLKVRNYREAAGALEWAVKLSPEEPEYLTSYAWALYKSSPGEIAARHRARELLQKSARLNPRHYATHLYLGYLHQNEGRPLEAQRAFERVIQCNPDCIEALRELRLSELRREAPQKGRLWKKLFGK